MIGVMFLIAVVSIVEGMGRYMEDDFAGRLLGANTFTLRRYPWFGNNTHARRVAGVAAPPARLSRPTSRSSRSCCPPSAHWAVESQDNLMASTSGTPGRDSVEAHAVDGDYFTIKKYDLAAGRTIAPQEYELGTPVVVIGDEVGEVLLSRTSIRSAASCGSAAFRIRSSASSSIRASLFGQSLDKLAIAPFNSPLHRLTNPRGDIDGLLVQSSSADDDERRRWRRCARRCARIAICARRSPTTS